jgi:DNA-binding response OmpR family regulator
MSNRTTPVVLVADDEPSMLALVARHVRTLGYEVLEASDGEAAWKEAENSLPDLVVLDVMMPGMSGWEVCRRIRENVGLHHTGVIMLTGIGQSLNELTSPLYGADAYIDKPFEFKDLDQKISFVLKARGHEPVFVEPPPPPSVDPRDDLDDYESDAPIVTDSEAQPRALDEEPTGAWNGREHSSAQRLPSFHDYDPEATVREIDDENLAPIEELTLGKFIKDREEDEFSSAVTLRPPPPAGKGHAALPSPPLAFVVEPHDASDEEEDEPVTQRPPPAEPGAEQAKPAKKAPAKKVAKKVAKKAPAKKAAKKAPAKKAAKTVAKKAPAKKAAKKVAKKAPAKKAAKKVAKKAPAKKAAKKLAKKPAKKVAKTVAKKAPAKKAAKKVAKKAPAKKAAKKVAKKAPTKKIVKKK